MLTSLQLVKKFPASHGTRRFITALKRPPTVSILGQPSPVHIPTFHLLQIHLNIIHPSMPRSSLTFINSILQMSYIHTVYFLHFLCMMGGLQLLWVITSICMFYLSITDRILIHFDKIWFIFFRFRTLLCKWDEKAPYLCTKMCTFYYNIFAHPEFISGVTVCAGCARKSVYETRSVQTDKNGTSRHFVCILCSHSPCTWNSFCVLTHPVHETHFVFSLTLYMKLILCSHSPVHETHFKLYTFLIK